MNIYVGNLPFSFDNGQLSAVSMFYSEISGTVLMSDWVTAKVFERRRNGTFVRSFEHPTLEHPVGVTRGPDYKVYVADHTSHRIFRFGRTGRFLEAIGVGLQADRPTGLVWTANVPKAED